MTKRLLVAQAGVTPGKKTGGKASNEDIDKPPMWR